MTARIDPATTEHMLSADWYEGVARSRRRWASAYRLVSIGFGVAALFSLAAALSGHDVGRWIPALGWSLLGAGYAAVHVAWARDRAAHYEQEAKDAPARNAHKRKMNEHYQMMNRRYGRSYEKIDEGFWSDDRDLLAKYAGLVSRWKPGGDLYDDANGGTQSASE